MNRLNDMALFVEVGKVMSFKKAADRLNIPSSTLSRRINHLEQEIGLRLLHRTTRKVEFTEAGFIYFERCKHIITEAQLAHNQLQEMQAQPHGKLRVSLPVDFGIQFLTPLFTEFAETYPQIQFEIDLTPTLVDLVTQNIDLAIRIGNPPDSTLIAHKLMQLQGQVFASKKYLAHHGIPQHPQDLIDHQCLTFPNTKSWQFIHTLKNTAEVPVKGRFILNNIGMMEKLAVLNQGIIFMPAEVVKTQLLDGHLERILPEWTGRAVPIYALTETRLVPAKVRIFIKFLRERLSEISENNF